jgi:hypothetical protein
MSLDAEINIPKEQFDLLLENQQRLAALMEKISGKLG